MKKPSEEQIREGAENYALSFGIDFKSPLRIKSFIAGAKWAISQMEQDDQPCPHYRSSDPSESNTGGFKCMICGNWVGGHFINNNLTQ